MTPEELLALAVSFRVPGRDGMVVERRASRDGDVWWRVRCRDFVLSRLTNQWVVVCDHTTVRWASLEEAMTAAAQSPWKEEE